MRPNGLLLEQISCYGVSGKSAFRTSRRSNGPLESLEATLIGTSDLLVLGAYAHATERVDALGVSKIEMDGDFHFDCYRRPIKQCWLIFPLQHRLQRRRYQQRVAADSVCSHYVSTFIDHGSDYHGAPDVCLPREFRILGLDR